jgi:hypothetical protein
VRGQACPAVSAELPVRRNLALAIEALLDELVKLVMELQQCGLPPALVGQLLWCFVVHCVPSVSRWNECNPRTPARAAWCTDAVPGSAADPGSSHHDPLRHRLCLRGAAARHHLSTQSRKEPSDAAPRGRPDVLSGNDILSLPSLSCPGEAA